MPSLTTLRACVLIFGGAGALIYALIPPLEPHAAVLALALLGVTLPKW